MKCNHKELSEQIGKLKGQPKVGKCPKCNKLINRNKITNPKPFGRQF